MVSSGDIFLNATDLMNNTFNYLIIHTEARDIEDDILFAANNGLFQVIASNTPMTNTVLPAVHAITSINLFTSTFVLNNHGYKNGDQVVFSSTGNLPAPISAGVVYYVIFVDANNFKVALTAQDAAYGTAIVLTSAAQTVATGTNQNPTFTVSSAIVIDGNSVSMTGTTLNQAVIDINTAAVPNIIASQAHGSLILTDTTGAPMTISGAAATTAGMPSSVSAATVSVQGISMAQQCYNVWAGLATDAQKSYLMSQVITHFKNLGYNITQQQNPQVPSVFQWVVSW